MPREAHSLQVPELRNGGPIMGKVATVFKVYPESFDQAEQLRSSIISQMKPTSSQLEDIGFGIKVIKVIFVFPTV